MSPGIYVLTILVLPVTAVIVFAMKYAASYAAARARIAEQDDLRALVASSAHQLSEMKIILKAIADGQADQTRILTGVDAMLREVG